MDVIEVNLEVTVGDDTTVHEIEVPVETEVHSFTPEEKPTFYSPGETASVDWTLRTAVAVKVNGIEVLAEGTEVGVHPIKRAEIEDQLIRDAREEAAVSRAGY